MSKSLSIVLVLDWECPISEFSFFDVGSGKPYFDAKEKDSFKSWYKTEVQDQLNELLAAKQPVAIYFSGTFLELLCDQDLPMIKKVKAAKHINILGGTFHHSLASICSLSHFKRELTWHQTLIKKLFGIQPNCFLNTQNIYFNGLTDSLVSAGYTSTFTGAIDWYLGDQPNQRIFNVKGSEKLKLLLVSENGEHTLFHDEDVKNNFIQLSVNQLEVYGGWASLIRKTKNQATIVSIDNQLKSEISNSYNVRQPISSSYDLIDLDQLKNYPLQQSWLKQLYEVEPFVSKKTEALQKIWSRLGSVGVLKTLNPELNTSEYNNSYDIYQSLINILSDLRLKL